MIDPKHKQCARCSRYYAPAEFVRVAGCITKMCGNCARRRRLAEAARLSGVRPV